MARFTVSSKDRPLDWAGVTNVRVEEYQEVRQRNVSIRQTEYTNGILNSAPFPADTCRP